MLWMFKPLALTGFGDVGNTILEVIVYLEVFFCLFVYLFICGGPRSAHFLKYIYSYI